MSSLDDNPDYQIIGRDLTSYKDLELELRNSINTATEALHVKSDFLSMMSHELRTPLNPIIALSELLLENAEITEENKTLLQLINKSGNSLLDLIDELLTYNLIDSEADGNSSELPFIDLKVFINDVYDLLLKSAEAKGVKFNKRVSSKLPSQIAINRQWLLQICNNLITNAIKFTEKGGSVTLKVGATEIEDDKYEMAISVTDTGIGIEEKNQKKIFDPFIQADNQITVLYGGAGLGLSICKRLIERMGGSIDVVSSLGEGSTFTIRLIVKYGETEPMFLEKDKDKKAGKDVCIPQLNILVIEDDLDNQIILKYLFKNKCKSLDIVDSSDAGLKRIKENDYDLILLDIQLPGASGFIFYEELKVYFENYLIDRVLPLTLALTAYAEAIIEKKCNEVGMEGYLTKPYTSQRLFSKIQDLLSVSS